MAGWTADRSSVLVMLPPQGHVREDRKMSDCPMVNCVPPWLTEPRADGREIPGNVRLSAVEQGPSRRSASRVVDPAVPEQLWPPGT